MNHDVRSPWLGRAGMSTSLVAGLANLVALRFHIPSPRNFLPIPGKELPVVFDAHVINDSKKLLNRVLASEKLPFWHVALEWLGEVRIYSPGME